MEKLSFVIWMVGFPIANAIAMSAAYKHGAMNGVSEISKTVGRLIKLGIYIWIAILLWNV